MNPGAAHCRSLIFVSHSTPATPLVNELLTPRLLPATLVSRDSRSRTGTRVSLLRPTCILASASVIHMERYGLTQSTYIKRQLRFWIIRGIVGENQKE